MINELVNSILEAEAKADGIISEANERATRIAEEAQQSVLRINAEAENTFRAQADALAKKNSAAADELYGKILAEGKVFADGVLNDAKTKTDKFADEVARCILSGNC